MKKKSQAKQPCLGKFANINHLAKVWLFFSEEIAGSEANDSKAIFSILR